VNNKIVLLSIVYLLSSILFTFSFYSCSESVPDKIENYLKKCYENKQFNGNVLVARNGKILYQNYIGIANYNPKDTLQLDSQYRLASLSKPFTATSIMILKERGKLKYEDDIQKYFPELPYKGVTIHHLLTHTSGIPDYENIFESYWDPDHENFLEKKYATNTDVIEMLKKYDPELNFNPGEKWAYSNSGYVLLASIVSQVSGEPFEVFMKNNIFDPLDMSNTLVYSAIRDDAMANRVYGYRLALNGSDYIPNDFHYMNGIAGDGAMYSTTGDLYKWDRALYTEKLVSRKTLEEAFQPVIFNNGNTYNYGYGWGVDTTLSGKKSVSHGGGWIGARTWLWREIEENNTIIILTNHTSPYIYDIQQGFTSILHDKPYSVPKIKIGEVIGKALATRNIEEAIAQYQKIKNSKSDQYNINKWELNNLGYELIRLGQIADAVEIFKLNVEAYPDYAGAYSGLGEAYRLNGNKELAIENFKKSLEIYPDNKMTKEKLKQLQTN
jgi:CubicO group peptidase (beta-lactamase class C family)